MGGVRRRPSGALAPFVGQDVYFLSEASPTAAMIGRLGMRGDDLCQTRTMARPTRRPVRNLPGLSLSTSVCDETPVEDLPDALLYINRELSLLDFFERVLDEARDRTNPLLERLKFIGIAQSVLGEFFMVRMAGLRQQVDAGVTEAVDGFTPQQLLPVVRERALGQMRGGATGLQSPAA